MLASLTASQYSDWLAWMRKTQPYPARNDPYWAMLLSMTHNQWCENGRAKGPEEFMIYADPADRFAEDITPEQLRARLGLKQS